MTWPHFEWSITLGTLMQIVTLLAAMLAAYVKIRERLTAIETKLNPVWAWWLDLTHPKFKTDEELDHEIRGLQQLQALRRAEK